MQISAATEAESGRKQGVVLIGRTALRLVTSYLRGVRPFLARDAGERALWLTRAGKRLPYHTLLKRLHQHADLKKTHARCHPRQRES